MKGRIALFVIVAILFAAAGFYANSQRLAPEPVTPSASEVFFSQQFAAPDGKQETMDKWKGKLLVVNFWATWCPPCVEEMPELVELQKDFAANNVQVLGIGIDSANNIRDFSAKLSISYPLYVAGMEGTRLSSELGNRAGGLPFTLLIGPDGSVVQTYLGRLDMKTLREDIRKHL